MWCQDTFWRTVPARSAKKRALCTSRRTEHRAEDTGGTGSHRGCGAQALERLAAAAGREASGAERLSVFRGYQSCGTQMSVLVVPGAVPSKA
jgi:hypothetical protein